MLNSPVLSLWLPWSYFSLLKSCLDSFLLPITTLINLSISESIFPDEFKSAIVTPLHKKNIPYQLKIFPAIVLFLISILSPKFLNALSMIVSIVILPLFPLYPPFSLHTANFTLLKLLSSAFTMISLSQLANTNFLLLYFLIFLPPSTLSIIIFFYLASLLTLVSLVLHFLSSHLIFPIALSLFPFNLNSLLLLPSPLAYLRVQSLVLFSSAYILRFSLTFFQTPLFRINFMLMILNST